MLSAPTLEAEGSSPSIIATFRSVCPPKAWSMTIYGPAEKRTTKRVILEESRHGLSVNYPSREVAVWGSRQRLLNQKQAKELTVSGKLPLSQLREVYDINVGTIPKQ